MMGMAREARQREKMKRYGKKGRETMTEGKKEYGMHDE
jgi:hypothetical protein